MACMRPEWNGAAVTTDDMLLQKLDMLSAGLENYAQQRLGSDPCQHRTCSACADCRADRHPLLRRDGAFDPSDQRQAAEVAKRNSKIILIDGNRALSCSNHANGRTQSSGSTAGCLISADATRHLATAFAGAYRTSKKGTAKVLALDMDNTLWGGIFGEDGVAKLVCDDEFPGNAFKAFQHECLGSRARVFCSRLEQEQSGRHYRVQFSSWHAVEGGRFRRHPHELGAQAGNIRSMAEELNLGLDSFVFIDDSPHEREAMRRMCPEMIVPELPDDPAARPQWLRALAVTWPIRLTEEDFATQRHVPGREAAHRPARTRGELRRLST